MRELLLDSFDFTLDHSKLLVNESETGELKYLTLPGRLSVCDTVNGNTRRYPRSVWEKNLKEDSPLMKAISRSAAFGLLEHPADGRVSLNSPLAVLATKAALVSEDATAYVDGEIRVLGTPEGRRLVSLIEAGYKPTVSSRGYGTLTRGADGVDEVQDDYVCEGWDVVMTPSFVQAELRPARESREASKPAASKAPVHEPEPALTESKTKQATSTVPETSTPPQVTIMDVKSINESLAAVKALDPAGLDAVSFAQGMARMHDLHSEVAAYAAEDRKRDWDGTVLHKAISAVEETWAAAVTAPRKEVKVLKESQTKLLKIIKELGTTALSYKTKLGEALKVNDRRGKLNEGLASRARTWMSTANKSVNEAKVLEKKYATACEALDLLAKRYKDDVTRIGQAVLKYEFADLSEAELKQVNEARHPNALVRARAAITETRKPAGKKPVVENKEPVAENKEPVAENKKPAGQNPPEAPAIEILRTSREMTLGESIAMGNRLRAYQPA